MGNPFISTKKIKNFLSSIPERILYGSARPVEPPKAIPQVPQGVPFSTTLDEFSAEMQKQAQALRDEFKNKWREEQAKEMADRQKQREMEEEYSRRAVEAMRKETADEAKLFELYNAYGIVPGTEADHFLRGEVVDTPESSNVNFVQYDMAANSLVVGYLGANPHTSTNSKYGLRVYRYWDVDFIEALSFLAANSKGTWVWDHLRVRDGNWGSHSHGYKKRYDFTGTSFRGVKGWNKNFTYLGASLPGTPPQGIPPKWMRSHKDQAIHAQINPHGGLPPSIPIPDWY